MWAYFSLGVPVEQTLDRITKSINELQLESEAKVTGQHVHVPGQLTTAELGKTALLIIDVQNCFLTGNLAVPTHEAIPVDAFEHAQDGASGDTKKDVPHFWEAISGLVGQAGWGATVISKDWHPQHHVSYQSAWGVVGPPGTIVGPPNDLITTIPNAVTEIPYKARGGDLLINQKVWPDHCTANHHSGTADEIKDSTPCTVDTCTDWDEKDLDGAHVAPNMNKLLVDHQDTLGKLYEVRKGTHLDLDSYSAFYGSPYKDGQRAEMTNVYENRGDFMNPSLIPSKYSLDVVLANSGIENVVVVGIALDICVKFSALDAIASLHTDGTKKFNVIVPTGATLGVFGQAAYADAVKEMVGKGVEVVEELKIVIDYTGD